MFSYDLVLTTAAVVVTSLRTQRQIPATWVCTVVDFENDTIVPARERFLGSLQNFSGLT